jgi:Xaa-Pro aminopeptidase
MKADLDRLMEELKLDAIVVLGDETPNSQRAYLTNRAPAHGQIFKKRGEQAVIIVSPMEIDEAAKSGLVVRSMWDFGLNELMKTHRNDREAIQRGYYQNIFQRLGIQGRVGLYGAAEVNRTAGLVTLLMDSALNVQMVIGGEEAKLFDRLYETKDAAEIAAMKEAGALTSQLVRDTWDFISGHVATGREVGSPVVDAQGKPLTIGAVKRFIRRRATELDLTEEDTIFAQGRDAGVPHSRGEADDVLQVGRSIVFDIFPRKIDTGYFHDMTRTWCIGHAPAEVQAAYDDVMHTFRAALGAMKVGVENKLTQIMALDYFESKGHPTNRTQPGTSEGYVHSLGHGLGLNVHEAPSLSEYSTQTLAPGNVITVEPGLYYPERGFGVRVEDTVYFDEQGVLHSMTDFPYDLVLPIRYQD